MSAVLEREHVAPVIADLERLQDIRRAIEDVEGAELREDERLSIGVSAKDGMRDQPIAFFNGADFRLACVALRAMEREVLHRLASKGVEVKA